jgi:hypothetical protein
VSNKLSIRSLLIAVALLLLAGCSKSGPDLGTVHGRVTLDGAPLNHAIVTFQPPGKSPGIGNTDQNGDYVVMYKRGVMGVPVGENIVTIFMDAKENPRNLVIPPRYNTESTLKREVAPGDNEFNFDLTSKEKE